MPRCWGPVAVVGNQIMKTESSALAIMEVVCRINGNNCTAKSAKECQEGKANDHSKMGMVERRPKHVGEQNRCT